MQTPEEIYDEITAEQQAQTALADLDTSGDTATSLLNDVSNGSKVSRHRLVKWVVAYAMWAQRVLYEIFKIDVQNLAKDGHYGTPRWFVATAKRFQYGDNFVLTAKDFYYPTINSDNQVVATASVTELGYKVIVKAVKDGPTGYRKLNADERSGLQDFFDEIKPPITVEVRSAAADKARIYGEVICDAKQGIANIKANADAAIVDYLANLDFNGIYSINKMRQAVLDVTGVIDFLITQVDTRIDGTENWVNVTRVTNTYAGHMLVDAEFSLDDTLNYKSSNV
jgi:hypothetical protein